MKRKHLAAVFLLAIAAPARAANSLSIGADYLVRGVSITERDKTLSGNDYYDQRLQAYLTADLSQDVEASVRVQSITPWGVEGSTTPLATRYPEANGGLWVQNAFIRLPNVFRDYITLTIGRQPIRWGDGAIVSDDELGFNAVRAHIRSPIRWLPVDLDAFTAKIREGFTADTDTDLNGAVLGFDRRLVHWEIMGLVEKSKGAQSYELGAATTSVTATRIERLIYGIRGRANLKDAYLKGEYYVQNGGMVEQGPGIVDIKIDQGSAFIVGLGGEQNTAKIGRFGAVLEYAEGSGDKASTPTKDEAFRPTFASRWSGLERKGYGRYFAATFSDAYNPARPFADASASTDGLPDGTSGIQSIHFGVKSTPWTKWSFSFDYFQFKALKNLAGKKDLGTEFDYAVEYRYSGLVVLRGTLNTFKPGVAFEETTRQKAEWASLEAEIRF